MKKLIQHLSKLSFAIMAAAALMLCSWEPHNIYNYQGRIIKTVNVETDTLPQDKQDAIDKAIQNLDIKMQDLDVQMKDMKINLDKQLESLSKINFEEIQKQTEASLKQIDWNKMQQDINISMQKAQKEIAKIDFAKMQIQMKDLQDKFKSDEFKAQFNSEKIQKEVNDAMAKAKEGIEKAKQELQQMKAFTDALATDGLIDKKKGYTIEWKDGDLYINNTKQPKDISDKYCRYEKKGKIKIAPEGVEYF